MNRIVRISFILLLTAFAAGAPAANHPSEKLSDFADFKVPEGWTATDKPNQGDPQVRLEKDLHRIKVRLSGGAGSRYKDAAGFLGGFEARSLGGQLCEKSGTVEVSGAEVQMYSRNVAVTLPPPGMGGPSTSTVERFCVVPAGKRFFILSYSYGDSIPDPAFDGKEAWLSFLKTFRVK